MHLCMLSHMLVRLYCRDKCVRGVCERFVRSQSVTSTNSYSSYCMYRHHRDSCILIICLYVQGYTSGSTANSVEIAEYASVLKIVSAINHLRQFSPRHQVIRIAGYSTARPSMSRASNGDPSCVAHPSNPLSQQHHSSTLRWT